MLLSLLPRTLLIPPVALLVTAVFGALLASFGRVASRFGRWLLGASLVGLLVLSIPIVPRMMRAGLEDGIRLETPVPGAADAPQAIVILSADGAWGGPTDGILAGPRLGNMSLERVVAGAELQARTGLPVLMSGGTFHGGPQTLAGLMDDMMRNVLHAPVRWLETHSTDTWGNAEFSAPILARDGVRSIYLVSDSWHLRRARIAFAHSGLIVWTAPVAADLVGRVGVQDFLPSVEAWLDSYYMLHEWIGCAVYALRS